MTVSTEAAAELDSAIDALLRDDGIGVPEGPLDDLVATARLLRDELPRYHPRFRFEEALAVRLRAAGQLLARPAEAGAGVIQLPVVATLPAPRGGRRRRGLVAGGAIASGVSIAIPLAGAALVAWRRGRSAGGTR